MRVALPELGVSEAHWYDLYGKRGWMAKDHELGVTLQPYGVVWLMPFGELERSIES